MSDATRLSGVLAGALALGLLAPLAARGDELPVTLQVQLLSKMPTYIDSLGSVGGATIKVLVVYPGPAETPSRGAAALVSAIAQVGQFGTAKAEPKPVPFLGEKKLQAVLGAEKPQVLYLAPEIDASAAAAIVQACAGSTTLTVTGNGDLVKLGVVLGFSLVEARPRVLVNLKQATAQNLVLRSGLLSHAVIVDR